MKILREKEYFDDFKRVENKMTASAKTCYSPNLKYPEKELNLDLNKDIASSGHDSTLGHEYVSLPIQTSRAHTLFFLHNHSNYVSDERSQRYTKIGPKNFFNFGDKVLERWNEFCYRAYIEIRDELMVIMKPAVQSQFGSRWEEQLPKKAQELARMVLPLSTKTNLWHTVNAETLTMYMKTPSNTLQCHKEFKKELMEKVICHSPTLMGRFKGYESARGITATTKDGGNQFHFPANINTAENMYNNISDEEKMDRSPLSPLAKMLGSMPILGIYNLSAAAVSQLQRHRLFNVRPAFIDHGGIKDFMYSNQFLEKSEAYNRFVDVAFCITKENPSFYFSPLGRKMCVEVNSDFYSMINFLSKRLCWNAQEELYDFAKSCFDAMIKANPDSEDFINKIYGAPCRINYINGVKPPCPEGKRYCGVPVWKQKTKEMKRTL